MEITYKLDEFKAQIAPNNQVMIYGVKFCPIAKWLIDEVDTGRFSDVFDFSIQSYPSKPVSDGSFIVPIQCPRHESSIYGFSTQLSSRCKAGLVTMVLTNYQREKEDLPLIPIAFILEQESSKWDIKQAFDRARHKSYTDAEIRRAYKLCCDPRVDERLRAIAQRSFNFLRINTLSDPTSTEPQFEKVPAPWDSDEWKELWSQWLSTKKTPPDCPLDPCTPWRQQLGARIH